MGTFLKENWIWIVAPIALVAITVVIVVITTNDDPAAPMTYTLR